jgi:hypothetical protein
MEMRGIQFTELLKELNITIYVKFWYVIGAQQMAVKLINHVYENALGIWTILKMQVINTM